MQKKRWYILIDNKTGKPTGEIISTHSRKAAVDHAKALGCSLRLAKPARVKQAHIRGLRKI